MKQIIKKLFFGLAVTAFSGLYATFIIDRAGSYSLGGDLIDPGVDVVQISASNVIFDLSENTISLGSNGIVIDPGISNVTVRNGRITQIINNGISIGDGCVNINLDNIEIMQCGNNAVRVNQACSGVFMTNLALLGTNKSAISVDHDAKTIQGNTLKIGTCAGSAIELLGTSTGNVVRDILLDNVITMSVCLSPLYTKAIRVDYGLNVILRNITMVNSGNKYNQLNLIGFNNCYQCTVAQVAASGNSGTSLTGINLSSTTSTIVQGVNLVNNNSLSGNLTGFLFANYSSNNLIALCRVLTSSATGGNAIGYCAESTSERTIFRDCDIAALMGTNVTGFDLHDNGSLGSFNLLEGCQVVNCLATTGSFVGFNIDGCDKGTVFDSVASYNSALLGRSVGLLFKTPSGGNRWNINQCKFVRNYGMDDNNSYGVLIEAGVENLFVKNFAFDNGQLANTQMQGVPLGSITQLTTDNLNSADTPWANIIIIP
ncbi:MAG: hypothetical protein AB7E68_05675 [Candidatus Babeliales bacterium]